jgi:hypothetical protein
VSLPAGQEEFWARWEADASAATEQMLAQHARGEKVKPDNDELWGRLKKWFLIHVFANKCAYCEGKYEAHAPQHAEHWRPKEAVTEPDTSGREVRVTRDGLTHPGYWWLAYDWQNLVPACFYCNTGEGKGTKFPIDGTYVFSPEEGRDVPTLDAIEKPWLLHPWFGRNPEKHIGFYEDGTAYAKRRGDEHAYWTITVMDLNREDLVIARRERQDEAVNALGHIASDSVRFGTGVSQEMVKLDGPGAPYSRAVAERLDPIRGRVGPEIFGGPLV